MGREGWPLGGILELPARTARITCTQAALPARLGEMSRNDPSLVDLILISSPSYRAF